MEMLVLFTSLQNIVILSIIDTVCAGVKSIHVSVVCPHNRTYDLCIFAFFSKNRFCEHSTFVLQAINVPLSCIDA